MVDLRSVLSRLYAEISRSHSASERFGITVFCNETYLNNLTKNKHYLCYFCNLPQGQHWLSQSEATEVLHWPLNQRYYRDGKMRHWLALRLYPGKMGQPLQTSNTIDGYSTLLAFVG